MQKKLEEQTSHEFKAAYMKEAKLKNINLVPEITAIVVSMTTKDATTNKKVLTDLGKQLSLVTGQKPIVTKARKSVATFKLREEMPIGLKITLRNKKLNNFYNKLIAISFPRIRDFKGFSKKAFDGQGNFNLGLKEQLVFPEIEYDKIGKIYGMNITIKTSARTDQEGYLLLKKLDFPFNN